MSDNEFPSRYGNFEVVARADGTPELLGSGSFGRTYKARHVFLDQVVALKVISEKFAHDTTAKERFLREARVVHGLRHPHIAEIMDFGEAHGTLYYAMEYCQGGSLEDLVRRVGPLDPTTVELLARQLAEALDASHRAGFIHRDVKPANAMLAAPDDAGTLKLVDFGLVKPLTQDPGRMVTLTLDGQSFFTPLFASPEQVMEEELDARSDLFSLGMTLWYLIKGATPESGSTAVVMAKRLNAESYQTQLPADLPPKLRGVLRKLLEKERERRFASAGEVLAALAARDPLPESAPDAVPPPVRARRETPTPPPVVMAEKVTPTAALADKYQILEKHGRTALGNVYRATRPGDARPLSVTVLDEALREDAGRMGRLRMAVALAAGCSHESLGQVYGLEEFRDAVALVREWHGGISLQMVARRRGSVPFAEALVPLRLIAAGVDAAVAAGLSGVRLAPDEIFLEPGGDNLAFADPETLPATSLRQWPPYRLRLTPVLLEDEEAQDVSMTFSEQAGGSPRVEFGSLLYRLVAGMQVKFAARVNRGSYIRTAGLSEAGNRVLSGCIADEADAPGDCLGVLAALQLAEGIDESQVEPAPSEEPADPAGRMPLPVESLAPTAGPGFAAGSARETGPATDPARSPVLAGAPPLHPAGTSPASTDGYVPAPVASFPSSPLVPVLIGLLVAAAVLTALALFLWQSQSVPGHRDDPAWGMSSPVPVASVSPVPVQVSPMRTPVSSPTLAAPPTFVLRDAARLPKQAAYELAGKPVRPVPRGRDLVFTLDPAAGSAADLVVKVPGYRPVRLSAGAGGSGSLPTALEREVVSVYLVLGSREADYTFITLSYAGPMPSEEVPSPNDVTYSLRNITSPARIGVPTGRYTYTLYGPGQQQDTRILPLKGSVTATPTGRAEIVVPPSFAGRYRGEFDDEKTRLHVVRTLTLKPGLAEGLCDEQYFLDGKLSDRSVDGVPLAEIRLDSDGVLRAHIRYVLYRNPAAHTYDEVFELRRNPAGELLLTGGRETMPDDPVQRSVLEKKLRDQPPAPADRPGQTVMRPVD